MYHLYHFGITFRLKWFRSFSAWGCSKTHTTWRMHHMHHKKSYGREHMLVAGVRAPARTTWMGSTPRYRAPHASERPVQEGQGCASILLHSQVREHGGTLGSIQIGRMARAMEAHVICHPIHGTGFGPTCIVLSTQQRPYVVQNFGWVWWHSWASSGVLAGVVCPTRNRCEACSKRGTLGANTKMFRIFLVRQFLVEYALPKLA